MERTLKLSIEQKIGTAFLGKIIHVKNEEELQELRQCLFRPLYRKKIVFTKNKERILHEPGKQLKRIQKLILEFILSEMPISEFAHAGVFGRSVVTNVKQHIFRKSFFKVDFKDTFPSVAPQLVYRSLLRRFREYEAYFKKYPSYSPEKLDWLAFVITRLTTCRGFLPQGAPTSLIILNFILFDLDAALGRIAEKWHLVYTRYSDDLWFSSRGREIPKDARKEIMATIKALIPLKINRKKTRYKTGTATVPRITGLNLICNSLETELSLPPYVINKCRGLIHKAAYDKSISKEKIFGIIGWVMMAYQGEIPWRIKKAFETFLKLRCSD